MKSDLHIHSDISDGSDSLQELSQKIVLAGIETVSLTDHDSVDGLEDFRKVLPANINLINGVELTCLAGNIKCHILGYFINPKTQVLTELLTKGKLLRRKKLETRINHLRNTWNIELTKKELDWLYSRHSVVKTHLANVIVNRGLADNNISAMKKYLDNCKTGNTKFDGEEAIDIIKLSGGIPVWAHPLGGEGEAHIAKEEFLERLNSMKQFGIKGLECYYSRYNIQEIHMLASIAKENNLYITGGSDYHGKNKDIPLGKLNTENLPVENSKLTLLTRVSA